MIIKMEFTWWELKEIGDNGGHSQVTSFKFFRQEDTFLQCSCRLNLKSQYIQHNAHYTDVVMVEIIYRTTSYMCFGVDTEGERECCYVATVSNRDGSSSAGVKAITWLNARFPVPAGHSPTPALL
jgi:hypothetical protein